MSSQWVSRGRCHVYGADVAHDNGLIDFDIVRARETNPDVLMPRLLKDMDPDFIDRVQQNDFIIAGERFGAGKAHTTAYIPMAKLNMRVLCESSFGNVVMGAANLGLPILAHCAGISTILETGEEIEVDLLAGTVVRLSAGETLHYPPLSEDLREIIAVGGRHGLLAKYLEAHPEMKTPLEAS